MQFMKLSMQQQIGYTLFYKNLLCKNMRLKNAQTLRTCYEHTEVEERRRTLILDDG